MSAGAETLGIDGSAPDGQTADELRTLRLRVAAQDRLIQAMLEENEQIHELRRSTHAVARVYDRYHASPVFALALRVWRRVRTVVPGIGPSGGDTAER